jgi:hypothetical protein
MNCTERDFVSFGLLLVFIVAVEYVSNGEGLAHALDAEKFYHCAGRRKHKLLLGTFDGLGGADWACIVETSTQGETGAAIGYLGSMGIFADGARHVRNYQAHRAKWESFVAIVSGRRLPISLM